MDSSFSPVEHCYTEAIQDAISRRKHGKVFFFNEQDQLDSHEGIVVQLKEIPGKGFFVMMDPQGAIRIDRIITLFGRPAAAYDEYDAYANQCLACTGGYDMDKLP